MNSKYEQYRYDINLRANPIVKHLHYGWWFYSSIPIIIFAFYKCGLTNLLDIVLLDTLYATLAPRPAWKAFHFPGFTHSEIIRHDCL